MDLIFDTPAIDLVDYGSNDCYGQAPYYWQDEDDFEPEAPSVYEQWCNRVF